MTHTRPADDVLLAKWSGVYGGVPPFDKVRPDRLGPAIEEGCRRYLDEIAKIATQEAPPTFENTFSELEKAGKELERVSTLFYVMTANMNDPEIQELSLSVEPKLAQVRDQVYFNSTLFARVKSVYDNRAKTSLDDEQLRLVEKTFASFRRRGADLGPQAKERLGQINQALATLFTDFGNRVLADENRWTLLREQDLAGLPKALIDTYRAAAQKRNLEGFAVVNKRSAVDPFLTFSSNRQLRYRVWRLFTQRGDNQDENDTNKLIQEIVRLRADRARLLGYQSHAHWRMSNTMAKKPQNAMRLMEQVWPAAVARVQDEIREMKKIAGEQFDLKPWDYRFYMEKVRKQRYDLDQTEFKKYFELENMISASYYMAERLYGYTFEEVTGQVPVFQQDVRVYRVLDTRAERQIGILYRDDFARQYKRSGAWQATFQVQHKMDQGAHAIVSNNNNFSPGKKGEPVLISLDDAKTLFHEFGHALHALSNDTTYPSLAGTPRDFVEFPSQVHENWVLTRDILDKYARHFETNKKMPDALIEKMRNAATFNQGFATVEYLAAAIVDMKLHTDPSGVVDPAEFEKKTLAEMGMPTEIVLRHRLPHFMHLFASDAYSAGYYSYLWSDVMAADAWMAFEETGDPWNPDVAKKFRDTILATGDAIDRAHAYCMFREREPRVEALLKNRGLLAN